MKDKFDIQDLRNLHDKHYKLLIAYARSIISSPEDAKEIVQDVFISMWRNRETIDKAKNLEAYLTKSVKNRCINFFKQNKKKTIGLENIQEVKESNISISEQLELAELKLRIYKAIDALPPKCRAIFLLSRDNQLSYKEIADKLDLSRKTVENQISIALRKLRIVMATWEDAHRKE